MQGDLLRLRPHPHVSNPRDRLCWASHDDDLCTLATTAVLLLTAMAAVCNFGPEAAVTQLNLRAPCPTTGRHAWRRVPRDGEPWSVSRYSANSLVGSSSSPPPRPLAPSNSWVPPVLWGADVCAVRIRGARTYRDDVSSCDEEPAAAAEDENDAATNSTTPTPTNDHVSVRGSRVQRAPIPWSVSTASLYSRA